MSGGRKMGLSLGRARRRRMGGGGGRARLGMRNAGLGVRVRLEHRPIFRGTVAVGIGRVLTVEIPAPLAMLG